MNIVCTKCLSSGKAKRETPGSIFIEIFLWLCFIVPGILYSFWRISNKFSTCKVCGSREVVPAESIRGQQILKETRTEALSV